MKSIESIEICPHLQKIEGVQIKSALTPKAVEVLLKHRAFFVKRIIPHSKGVVGQVSWAKSGGVENAWVLAQQNAAVKPIGNVHGS